MLKGCIKNGSVVKLYNKVLIISDEYGVIGFPPSNFSHSGPLLLSAIIMSKRV